MRLVSVGEMRAADHYTIEKLGIPSLVLMEEAGRHVTELCLGLLRKQPTQGPVVIWAGRGNNGGDGFVVARRLKQAGYYPEVFLVCPDPEQIKGAARKNLDILRRLHLPVRRAWSRDEISAAAAKARRASMQVDALLGTGTKGDLAGPLAEAVAAMNKTTAPIVAVDLPSGLNADTGEISAPVVKANYTVTIGRAKPGLVTYPGAEYVGELRVADIGIPDYAYDCREPKTFLIESHDVAALLPPWPQTAHKGNRGRVFVAAGSTGLTGAACLTSRAALRSGAGLVTLGVPESLHNLMEIKLTEVMTSPLPDAGSGILGRSASEAILEHANSADSLAIGPGLGQGEGLAHIMATIVQKSTVPTVIDADGLNALPVGAEILADKRAPLVLTPHPGELARLAGITVAAVQARRLPLARELAQKWGVVLVLKGARTIVATPKGSCYINPTGGPALATAGSGDVLTGMVAAFLARGLTAIEAALAGTYVHGLAGDLAAKRSGSELGIVAGDLISILPEAFATI
ncbi:MAG: NAD(P)H-hydrate dehydratase [Firmicutes bacterium]|nr:NAD(P)H-hydrate dehydratase [Bacillota bacterium]